jgi:hypothetical protein
MSIPLPLLATSSLDFIQTLLDYLRGNDGLQPVLASLG